MITLNVRAYQAPAGHDYQWRLAAWPQEDPQGSCSRTPIRSILQVRDWVPQLAVLCHASLFVTHAGTGGCSEGLFHGVPMIAVSQAVDQFSNAEMPRRREWR